jgi:hypothetical protein
MFLYNYVQNPISCKGKILPKKTQRTRFPSRARRLQDIDAAAPERAFQPGKLPETRAWEPYDDRFRLPGK